MSSILKGAGDKVRKDLNYWLYINKNVRIGAIGFKQLLDTKVPFDDLYKLPKSKLGKLKLSNKLITEIIYCQENIDPEGALEELASKNISIITLDDNNYPTILKEIYDPPAIIYYKGKYISMI